MNENATEGRDSRQDDATLTDDDATERQDTTDAETNVHARRTAMQLRIAEREREQSDRQSESDDELATDGGAPTCELCDDDTEAVALWKNSPNGEAQVCERHAGIAVGYDSAAVVEELDDEDDEDPELVTDGGVTPRTDPPTDRHTRFLGRADEQEGPARWESDARDQAVPKCPDCSSWSDQHPRDVWATEGASSGRLVCVLCGGVVASWTPSGGFEEVDR
jgi:hypothetical protein